MSETQQKEDLWGYAKRLEFVKRSIAKAFPGRGVADTTILDVGCGTGSQLGVPLARDGFNYVGVDTHKASIEEGERLAADMPNATFSCYAVGELQAGPFDVVILSEVLEHVAEPDELLAASLQKLKADGLMIVTVPNGFGEFEWDSWVFAGLGLDKAVAAYKRKRSSAASDPAAGSTMNIENGHVQFFTMRRLSAMFVKAGLEVIDKRGSTIMSGPFVGHTLARIPAFIDLNSNLADRLPMELASGWFFSLRRKERQG